MSITRKIAAYRNWKIVWEGGMYADISPIGGSAVDIVNLNGETPGRGELRNLLRDWLMDNREVLGDYLASAGQ